jgi:hypothetical protein
MVVGAFEGASAFVEPSNGLLRVSGDTGAAERVRYFVDDVDP